MNVLRTPGRAAVGAVSLAVGVTALTMLAAVTFAFRGVLVGSLLGNAVAVQVRGVDYVAVTATVALGVLAVADVVFLNIRDRAAELATIRAFGWRKPRSAAWSSPKASSSAWPDRSPEPRSAWPRPPSSPASSRPRSTSSPPPLSRGGLLVTAVAALFPAQALRRLPAAHLLAAD